MASMLARYMRNQPGVKTGCLPEGVVVQTVTMRVGLDERSILAVPFTIVTTWLVSIWLLSPGS